ncbi:MAG: bifunctional hydroxymethylpyrimidine kinase/phosphomethylpyrimidine kinase [Peptostreptococcaceae bacterium]|nr:bifunctional hydroxymethylpyrimidine kinase/phosphomethylpyrimidine kinase [Peptostreptococcaceae bacterium]
MKKVLTIAGSDCSGGAGIQADLKTMTVHKVFGMSVITAITAQNTLGVTAIEDVSPDVIAAQMDAVFTDIFPDAVKIGMVSNIQTIEIIANKLLQYQAKNIVLDPLMVSTSGTRLIAEDEIAALEKKLFPIANLITPNLYEAEILSGFSIRTVDEMKSAAQKIFEKYKVAVLIKGGHLESGKMDILFGGQWKCFDGKLIENPNTHGTGCTLSSAIASNLALGKSLEESVASAKAYVAGAIADGLAIGSGRGPLNHMYHL